MADPGATPLSNADFRQFFDQPRQKQRAAAQRQPKQEADGSQPAKKSSKPRKYKPKREEEEKEEGPSYRDRAEERRKGFNPDYEQNELKSATGADLTTLSVEDTKFLGGDVEHTHLVKGLDYALLTKVKQEQIRAPAVAKAEELAKPQVIKQGPTFATPLGRAVHAILFDPARSQAYLSFQPGRMSFQYDLDDPVVDTMLATVDAPVLERLAKVLSYVRISTKHGKKLKRKDKLRMLDAMDAAQRQAVRSDPSAQQAQPPLPPLPAEEPEDIFGEAGSDYQLQPRAPKGIADIQANGNGSYFEQPVSYADLPALPKEGGEEDMEVEENGAAPPPPPGPPPQPPLPDGEMGPARPPEGYDYAAAYGQPAQFEAYMQANIAQQASADPEYQALVAKQQELQGGVPLPPPPTEPPQELTAAEREAGLASVFKRADGDAQRREQDARERDPAYISDAYAECYPGYHGYAGTVVDSDDEDFSHMDSKERGKGRADFETEEQWQAYKGSKEAAPKAAFQFGVKVAGGRKAHKDLGAKAREQKEKSQLNKIQAILEKDGDDFGAAFAAPPKEEAGPGFTKKRRI